MSTDRPLRTTTSLCPTCLERVPGDYVARDGAVHLRRTCPDHGETSRKVWGSVDHWEWAAGRGPEPDPEGELTVANDHACLAVVEVTERCNLSCSYCFASSGADGRERPTEEVIDLLETVCADGPRPVQFSGGEPTVRDDLPALIEQARAMGIDHVQVNTNGVRLAVEDGYAARLAEAGATAIYLQFDGVTPETYETIREVDLTDEKAAAIEACREADLPVVLVPTVVPGVNDDEMGAIVEYALDNLDVVESINFQPVADFGRTGEETADHEGRYALDEAARAIADQLGFVDARDFTPIPCCSAYCQSATALLPEDDGVIPVTDLLGDGVIESLTGMVDESDWLELLANTPAGADGVTDAASCCGDACCGPSLDGMGALFEEVLPISFTGFMDREAADAGRLSNCCVAVPTPGGELVPFCAYNMTNEDGEYAIRNRNDWGGRPSVDAPRPSDSGPAAGRADEDVSAGGGDAGPTPDAPTPRVEDDE